MLINMDELKQRLQERQCKLTPQRKIILEVFLNNQDQHLSAEDVHTILRQELSEIGLATVYRTLELLCDMEILHKIDFGDVAFCLVITCRFVVANLYARQCTGCVAFVVHGFFL